MEEFERNEYDEEFQRYADDIVELFKKNTKSGDHIKQKRKTSGAHAKNNPAIKKNKNKFISIINNQKNRAFLSFLLTIVTIGSIAIGVKKEPITDQIEEEIVEVITLSDIDAIFDNLENENINEMERIIIYTIEDYLYQPYLSDDEKMEIVRMLANNDKNSQEIKKQIISTAIDIINPDLYIQADYDEIDQSTYESLTSNQTLKQAVRVQSQRFAIPEEILLALAYSQVDEEEIPFLTMNNILNINFNDWGKSSDDLYALDLIKSNPKKDQMEFVYLKDFAIENTTSINKNVEFGAAILRICLNINGGTLLNESSFSTNSSRSKDALDYYFYRYKSLSELTEKEMTRLIIQKTRFVNFLLKYQGELMSTIECPTVSASNGSINYSYINISLSNLEKYTESYYYKIIQQLQSQINTLESTQKNL